LLSLKLSKPPSEIADLTAGLEGRRFDRETGPVFEDDRGEPTGMFARLSLASL
jgi:hypothetical protein